MTTQTEGHLQTSAAGARHHPQVQTLQAVHPPADCMHELSSCLASIAGQASVLSFSLFCITGTALLLLTS